MPDPNRKAAVGFAGGQVLSLRLSESQLNELREAGLRLIDETPRTGIRGSQVAFLHPATAGGVLTELVTPVEVHP